MSAFGLIGLSLWAIMATAVHASIGSASSHVSDNISPVTRAQTVSPPTSIFSVHHLDRPWCRRRSHLREVRPVPDQRRQGRTARKHLTRRLLPRRPGAAVALRHQPEPNYGGLLQPMANGDFATTCWSPQLQGAPATYMIVYCYPGDG
ncbi:uncharacterized protein PG986_005880 [Apiospora aurea]|uniref:Uncharacterized protein n=1 Tax=Apiospora aurea TaxID=335848 RepID=A0ABR1QIU6_9PEZI